MLTPRQLHLTSLTVPLLSGSMNNELAPTALAPVVPVPVQATLPRETIDITTPRDEVMLEAPQSEEGELFTLMTGIDGKKVLVRVARPVRSSPAEHIARAKMPAPPKFGGMLDSNITSIEVWVRDVQRYAHRIRTPVKEVLEVLTQGPARINVDNMLRDPSTAALSDDAFADKFVMYYMQQVQPKNIQARDKLYNGVVRMQPGSKLQTYAMEFRAVIMDAEPILPTDAIFYFKQGLLHELKVECLTDAVGQPFTSLDALITHAFV